MTDEANLEPNAESDYVHGKVLELFLILDAFDEHNYNARCTIAESFEHGPERATENMVSTSMNAAILSEENRDRLAELGFTIREGRFSTYDPKTHTPVEVMNLFVDLVDARPLSTFLSRVLEANVEPTVAVRKTLWETRGRLDHLLDRALQKLDEPDGLNQVQAAASCYRALRDLGLGLPEKGRFAIALSGAANAGYGAEFLEAQRAGLLERAGTHQPSPGSLFGRYMLTNSDLMKGRLKRADELIQTAIERPQSASFAKYLTRQAARHLVAFQADCAPELSAMSDTSEVRVELNRFAKQLDSIVPGVVAQASSRYVAPLTIPNEL